MARVSHADIEKRFYDVFAAWDKADRETALKVLATLHEHLPAKQTKAPAGNLPFGTEESA